MSKKKNKKKFIIVDANALLHRAFHALPPLKTKEKGETGAVYGFLLTLFRAIKDLNPDFLAVCFDAPGPTFRHKKFEEYKAQRPKTAEELVDQIPKTKEILESFQIPIFEKKGFEADDLIGTISERIFREKNEEIETYIVSGDLDVLQLVDKETKVYTLGKGIKDTVIYNKEKIISRYGIPPQKLIDYKALVGDPSDNIPGVPGVGKKTGSLLLNKFKNLEEVYEKIKEREANLSSRIKNILEKHKKEAFLSKELVKIKKDVPIDFNPKKCLFEDFDQKKIVEVFKKFNFNTLIKRLPSLLSSAEEEKCSQQNLFEKIK